MSVDYADLLDMRVTQGLSVQAIAGRLGLSADQAKHLLARHGIKLSPEAARAASSPQGRKRARPNPEQRAWGTGRAMVASELARITPDVPRPRIVGTDLREMINRALASDYPVTVVPPAFADGSCRLTIGAGVG